MQYQTLNRTANSLASRCDSHSLPRQKIHQRRNDAFVELICDSATASRFDARHAYGAALDWEIKLLAIDLVRNDGVLTCVCCLVYLLTRATFVHNTRQYKRCLCALIGWHLFEIKLYNLKFNFLKKTCFLFLPRVMIIHWWNNCDRCLSLNRLDTNDLMPTISSKWTPKPLINENLEKILLKKQKHSYSTQFQHRRLQQPQHIREYTHRQREIHCPRTGVKKST